MDQSPQPPRTSVGILVLHWAAATVHRSSQRRRWRWQRRFSLAV